MSAAHQPTRIFISYARADLEHLHLLEKHLANLKRQQRIEVWTDQVLEPGARWEPTLLQALHAADILLCLVTADFMASNFIHDVELKHSFERERLGQVRIIPVLVRPTDLKGHPLNRLQGLPRGFQPITLWQNSDQAWLEVVIGLRTVLDTPLTPQNVPQPLPEGYAPLYEDHPPSTLLVARYGVVPFFQSLQAQALERIHTWLEDPRRFHVLLVTGDAGTGKTRLLYEVVARRREACWVAGLLDARLLDARQSLAELKPQLEEALRIPHPLLVAIDYAETAPELGRLLEWLQQQAGRRAQPVRVLLAARGAGDWWQSLALPLNAVLRALLKAEPVALGAESSRSETLTDLYRQSLRHFAQALNRPCAEPLHGQTLHGQALHGKTQHDQTLSQRPLFVLLTALAQTLGLPTKAETLLEEVVHHEQQFWRSLLPEHAYEQEQVLGEVHRLVAAVALRGGLDSDEALSALFQRLSCSPELTMTRARGFLCRVYPGHGPLRIRPVEPDLLAAELIRQVLVRPGRDTLLEPALSDNHLDALATAFRLLEDIGQQDEGLSRRALETVLSGALEARALPALQAATRWKGERPRHLIAEVLLVRLKQGASADLLVRIHNALPRSSLALADLALWVTAVLRPTMTWWQRLFWWCLSLIGMLPPNAARRALFLNNEGARLSDLGRREEALAATQEAVSLYRRLAEQAPDAFSPDLAMSLNNLGNRLSDLGRREEALAATQEAVSLYRRLAELAPDAFIPVLAGSLNNLGSDLSALGRREEALVAAREAVMRLTPFFFQLPQAYGEDWVMYARNLRTRCQESGINPALDPELQSILDLLEQFEAQASQQ